MTHGLSLQNWADMEREYRVVQAECEELQEVLQQRDEQLLSLEQNMMDLSHRLKVCAMKVLAIACDSVSDCIPRNFGQSWAAHVY